MTDSTRDSTRDATPEELDRIKEIVLARREVWDGSRTEWEEALAQKIWDFIRSRP